MHCQENLKCSCVYTQETEQLFKDIRAFAQTKTREQNDKLVVLLLEYELVETVQRLWRLRFNRQLLEKTELPDHLKTSMEVIRTSMFHTALQK